MEGLLWDLETDQILISTSIDKQRMRILIFSGDGLLLLKSYAVDNMMSIISSMFVRSSKIFMTGQFE